MFTGFTDPKENWSKLPHELIAQLPTIETIGEMKVILYVLRHTWGYHDTEKKITMDEFMHGRKTRDGNRIDNGTGLSEPTLRSGIEKAVEHGFLTVETDDSDKGRIKKIYSLTQKDLPPDPKESLPRTEKDTKKETKKDISPCGEKAFQSKPQTQTDSQAEFDSLPSANADSSKSELSAGVASEWGCQSAWRRKYAPLCARIMRDPAESKKKYRVAVDAWRESKVVRACGVELLDAQLEHYANGGGEKFRKPNAKGREPTPFDILFSLEDDLPKLKADSERIKNADLIESEREQDIRRAEADLLSYFTTRAAIVPTG